jgi:hypothetical protein
VPRKNLIGEVFATYWPPNRISIYSTYVSFGLFALGLVRLPLRIRRRRRWKRGGLKTGFSVKSGSATRSGVG